MFSGHYKSHIKSWKNKKKKLQRTTKLKPFINKYNWERTNFSSKADD